MTMERNWRRGLTAVWRSGVNIGQYHTPAWRLTLLCLAVGATFGAIGMLGGPEGPERIIESAVGGLIAGWWLHYVLVFGTWRTPTLSASALG